MNDDWTTYVARRERQVTQISFLDNAEQHLAGMSHAVRLTCFVVDCNDVGLPTDTEMTRLNEIGFDAEQRVQEAGGRLLGRVTDRHTHLLAGVLPGPDIMDLPPPLLARVDPDPDMSVYFDLLCPSPEERRQISDETRLRAMMAEGDVPQRERTIQHEVTFDSEREARVFANWLGRNGFEVVSGGRQMRFAGIGRTFWHEVRARSQRLQREVHNFGGLYIGWDAPVVTRADG